MLSNLEVIQNNLGELCVRLNELDVLFSGVKPSPDCDTPCMKNECLEDVIRIIVARTNEAIDYTISIKKALDGGKN